MTKSILVFGIYDMVNRFNLRFVMKQMVATIYKTINWAKVPFILSIDSYLLYKYLIYLGITSKKRLIIDIMTLKQLYRTKNIDEI